jgi:putative hydrolase of the HAD superfamily
VHKQRANGAIQAVILDFGDVLSFPPSDAAFARMAAVLDVASIEFKTHYFAARRPYDRGDCTAEAYWSAVAERARTTAPTAAIAKLRAWDVEMWSQLNPVMLAWLSELRTAGFATGLLSNMHADMVEHARRGFAWLEGFDELTFSHEARSVKPEAELYRRCLAGLGVAAEAALFIDDRELNVEGARALGMRAIRFDSVSQLETELVAVGFPLLPNQVATASSELRALSTSGTRVDT